MSCRSLALWLLVVALTSTAVATEAARDLYRQFGCAACHEPSAETHLPPARGPVLDSLGNRLKASWIRRFLSNPQSSSMPDMLAHLPAGERVETINNLTAFLTDAARPPAAPRFSDPVNGKRLYESIGCAVCHEESLPKVSTKYHFGGLQTFLADPLASHPEGRMPSLSLRPEEAGDLAHYLLPDYQTEPVPKAEAAQVAAGRLAFQQHNCASCHTRKGMQALPAIRPMADLTGPDCAGPPHYTLSEEQRSIMTTNLRDLPTFTPETRLAAHMRHLDCVVCHHRDQQGGPNNTTRHLFTGDDTLGNEGRYPPHLNGVGRKLTTDWLGKVFAGKGAVRPYLNVRMPVFGNDQTAPLLALFTEVDHAPSIDEEVLGDIQAGHQLMGVDGGMGCITCHAWGPNEGVAMRGLNLSTTTERLRFEWFKTSLIAPQTMRPGTLMPSFWPNGKSGNPNILAGDTNQQIASLWQFLKEGTQTPIGFPDPGSGRFEILPKDRPVVQRGFITPGGTSAIAVGFPEGIHFVYDGKAGTAVGGWKGRFLDGYKLWFSRLDPTAEPLGESWHAFEPISNLPSPRQFKGYRLDPDSGVPTFLLQSGSTHFEDTLTPLPNGVGFKRILRMLGTDEKTNQFRYQW